jgi:aspartyl/asparaginyl beta-hydroxylase (cupin superfamily)
VFVDKYSHTMKTDDKSMILNCDLVKRQVHPIMAPQFSNSINKLVTNMVAATAAPNCLQKIIIKSLSGIIMIINPLEEI